jgi:hypothetical protein
MSQGREGYVPGGYKIVGGHTGDVGNGKVVVLQYRNKDGKKFTRVTYSNQKGYNKALYALRKLNRRTS